MAESILVLMFACLLSVANAKQKFSIALEAGATTSGISLMKKVQSSSYTGYEKTNAFIRPMAGVAMMYQPLARWSVRTGIQYWQAGSKYHLYNEANDRSYSCEVLKTQRFNKLILPLVAAYNFKLNALKCNYSIGLQKGFFLAGTYLNETTMTDYEHPEESYTYTQKLDPFSKADFSSPASKQQWGILSGFGVQLSNQFSVDLAIALTPGISYHNHIECITPNQFRDNNLSLKCSYNIFSKK